MFLSCGTVHFKLTYLQCTCLYNTYHSLERDTSIVYCSINLSYHARSSITGGYDVKTISPFWFRKRVGIVSQEPVLFACSIKENIAFGKEDATMEEVRH